VEDRGPTVTARRGARALAGCLTIVGVLGSARADDGVPLGQRIPSLFGGSFVTSISPRDVSDAQTPRVADRFRSLSSALAVARSQAPIPSATGAFRFEWDDDLDSYVRVTQSLGPIVAERAQTLGRRTLTFSFSYTRLDFNTLDGDSLHHLQSVQPALSSAFINRLPSESDRVAAGFQALQTNLSLNFGFDLFFFTAAYGLTDSIDVSLSLSVNQARMSAQAGATIVDTRHPDTNVNAEGAFFTVKQKGVVVGGSGDLCGADFRCTNDSFSDSAFGTGDLFLRGKWHFYDFQYVDLAVAGVLTLPTGNADELLGFHDPTFTPWLIASKTFFDRVEPHINLGYSIRSSEDVSQAEWIAGTDLLATQWLTLDADFLGFYDTGSNSINGDVYQSAVGFKVNPFGRFVLAANFQFPLNDVGLRADVIYSAQVEYTY
jgi:hypothetical protein